MSARGRTLALLAIAALATGACGESEKTASTDLPSATPPATTTVTEPDVTVESPASTATTATTPAPARTSPSKSSSISKDLKTKPAIPKPSGTPPTKLVVKDIVKGTGRTAKAGDAVSVQYVGVSFSTGEQFDASWDRGQPFEFQLGAQMVIPGWDQGVAGMKVGGRRELTIPPELAYGPQGQPPTIGPNETLIFVIDLVSIA